VAGRVKKKRKRSDDAEEAMSPGDLMTNASQICGIYLLEWSLQPLDSSFQCRAVLSGRSDSRSDSRFGARSDLPARRYVSGFRLKRWRWSA
jgi:hypothetical protein